MHFVKVVGTYLITWKQSLMRVHLIAMVSTAQKHSYDIKNKFSGVTIGKVTKFWVVHAKGQKFNGP